MLAAEFHYLPDYIDEYMDIPLFDGHMRYRETCPPVGMIIKALFNEASTTKNDRSQTTTTQENNNQELREFIQMMGGIQKGGGNIG